MQSMIVCYTEQAVEKISNLQVFDTLSLSCDIPRIGISAYHANTCQQSGCRSKQKAKDRGDGVVLCGTCERNRPKSAVEDIDGNDDAFAEADAEGGADGGDS